MVSKSLINNESQEIELSSVFDDTVFNASEDLQELKIKEVRLLEKSERLNSSEGLEGELLIVSESKVRLNVDINGNLLLSCENSDSFYINDQGELIHER